MKLIFALLLLSALPSFAQEKSEAEQAAEGARSCFKELGIQISIGLSQAYHGAMPGTPEERNALSELELFNEELAEFPVFETGCNEGLDGDERFLCHRDGYAAKVRSWVQEHHAEDTAEAIAECGSLL